MAKKSESKQDTAKLEKALDTVCELLTKRYELCPDQQKNGKEKRIKTGYGKA